MGRAIRILIAKPGLDGHDRGAKLISRVLVEAGVEVIYTGKFQTPEQIVGAAIQEGVDGIGLSILSGSHMTMFRKVLDLLKQKKVDDVVVFGGGVIMPDDIPQLQQMGVDRIFPPDTPTSQIVDYVKGVRTRRNR
ncbi:MAG: cobalamin B12-binding domain-containing protein [Syntrophorhabdales bacterium]